MKEFRVKLYREYSVQANTIEEAIKSAHIKLQIDMAAMKAFKEPELPFKHAVNFIGFDIPLEDL